MIFHQGKCLLLRKLDLQALDLGIHSPNMIRFVGPHVVEPVEHVRFYNSLSNHYQFH